MNKDLILHLRLKGRPLKDVASEVNTPLSVVHLYFKKYTKDLIDKWAASQTLTTLSFEKAYTDFNTWCENGGYTSVTIKDFKSSLCIAEKSSNKDLLVIEKIDDVEMLKLYIGRLCKVAG